MFDFPHIEHQSYTRNFLKTIIFQISYDEKANLFDKKSEIINIFKEILPRFDDKVTNGIHISFSSDKTPILHNIEDSKTGIALEFKSLDGQRILTINKSSLSYTIGGKAYTNFENLKKELCLLDRFYKLCEIDTIHRVAIRKINIFEFKVSVNPSDILAHLISSDLLSNLNYFPKSSFIKQNIHTISYLDGGYRLNIKYGLNVPPPPNTEIGQVIVDIDLFSTETIDTRFTLIKADEINNEIFDIFNWAISDNTKKILNGEN